MSCPSGLVSFTFQWFKGTNAILNATNDCLLLGVVTPVDSTNYTVRVNGFCNAATNMAILTVYTNVTSTPLTDVVECPGANVTFTTTPSGNGPFSFMWFRNGVMINGATTNSLTLSNATTASAGIYRVKVSGLCNSVTNQARLTVQTNTTIVGPDSQTVCEGTEVTLCVVPFGSGPFTFQWLKGTNLIANATNDCLVFNPVALGDAWDQYGASERLLQFRHEHRQPHGARPRDRDAAPGYHRVPWGHGDVHDDALGGRSV